MKKFFLIPLMTLFSCVMAWANVAQITFSDARAAVDCADAAALKTAVAALPTDGTVATITLLDDADGGSLTGEQKFLVFPANTKSILDLNGHTLFATLSTSGWSTCVISNNGELTINDGIGGGKVKNSRTGGNTGECTRVIENYATMHIVKCIIESDKTGIDNRANAELTIDEEVTIDVAENSTQTLVGSKYGYSNGGVAICARDGSSTTINGGIIKSHKYYALYLYSGTQTVTINGGDFYGVEGFGWLMNGTSSNSQLTISGGSFDMNPVEYVDEDHYVELVAGRYVINAYPDPIVATVYTLAELKEKLNQASNVQAVYVTLGADINVAEVVTLQHGSQLTIPAGRTLTVQDGGLFVNEGRTINNGTIATIDNGFFSKPASVEGNGAISISNLSISVAGDVVTYLVSNGMQLQYLAYLASLDEYEDKTWNIALTTDINLPADASFEPISSIKGTFDGNEYAINNLTMVSEASSCALILDFDGTFQNLIINNVDIRTGGSAAALFIGMQPNSVVKNVKINGSINTQSGYAAGFVESLYQIGEEEDHFWFVNCENDVDVTTVNGAFAGGFTGTLSGSKGTLGLYNCSNKGTITGQWAGAISGYGFGAELDVIAFTNTGTIDGPDNAANWKVGGVNYIGSSSKAYSTTYLNASVYTAVYEGGVYVAKEAGTLDNSSTDPQYTDWATAQTWTKDDNTTNVVPNESDNVTVSKDVEVNDGTDAEANKVTVAAAKTLTIKEGGSLAIGENGLTIAADAIVKVEKGATLVIGGTTVGGDKGGITIQGEGEHAGKLIVEATQADGTGVVLVDPEAPVASTRVEAEVELIPDAHKDGDKYVYRYFGIPLYFEPGQEFTAANWEKEPLQDGESTTTYFRPWVNGAWAGDLEHGLADLVPFKGYGISNESTHGVKYTFKGKLVGNGDGTMNFVNGFNLFANSYTAPINIQTLLNGFTDDVKATIYMFQGKRLRSVSKADFAGYRTPRFTVIPSMQAFFVLMDDGTSAEEIVDYSEAVFNNSLPNSGLYAPQRQETPEFNRVRINIADENGENDEVYLIEAADFTSDFENGYDEVKYMNNGLNLFATTAYGRQTTEITNDINGTFIGIQGNGTYTLSFDELVGEEYQIRDLQTNAVVTMSEANTYTFTANGTNDARFVVESIAKMPTSVDNVGEAKMFINNNTLYISENNSNANIMIYAANGQLVLDEIAQPTVSLNGLASGVYTVRVANQTIKFVK